MLDIFVLKGQLSLEAESVVKCEKFLFCGNFYKDICFQTSALGDLEHIEHEQTGYNLL